MLQISAGKLYHQLLKLSQRAEVSNICKGNCETGRSTSLGTGYQTVCIECAATKNASKQLGDKMYLRNNNGPHMSLAQLTDSRIQEFLTNLQSSLYSHSTLPPLSRRKCCLIENNKPTSKKHPKRSKYKSRIGTQLKTGMLKKASKHGIKYCDTNTAYIKSESEKGTV